MLRQERAASGQAQERLLAAEKELERLRDAETQLDRAEKVPSPPCSDRACNEPALRRPAMTIACSTASFCLGSNFF